MNFIVPYIGNVIIPTDDSIIFQRGRSTTNQITMVINGYIIGLLVMANGINGGIFTYPTEG